MIAVDTNLLVYAHRAESPFHERALASLSALINGRETWAIPWPCAHEFLAVVTNRRALRPPSPLEHALGQLGNWLDSPNVVLLQETARHWSVLAEVLRQSGALGGLVHDARIAALCVEHGVRELWTMDRDFARFPSLITFNPIEDDIVHDHAPAYAAAMRARAAGRRRALGRGGN